MVVSHGGPSESPQNLMPHALDGVNWTYRKAAKKTEGY